jgi:hypothetical protein
MGDSASGAVIRKLLHAPGIRLFSFNQADGYVRRFTYLNKLELPMGSIDFGKNVPPQDTVLIGPTVELIARVDLHPAMSDLLLDAMKEVHGRASLLQHRGEFPAPLENEFRISPDAARYYKTGKSFLYRSLPLKIASFLDRSIVVLLPSLVFLIPALRMIPTAYRWRIRLRLLRWYRALLALEREVVENRSTNTLGARRPEFVHRLNHIEQVVNNMKVPASFADQFYSLRGHIGFVRDRLSADLKV